MAVSLYAWNALDGNPPASNYAVFSTVNSIPFLSFATGISTTFIGVTPLGAALSAGGVTVQLQWASATATSGSCNWGVAWENLGVATTVSDHFGTLVTSLLPVGGTVAIAILSTINIPYANMGSATAGSPFRLQVQRVTSTDTLVGAAQLFSVEIHTP